MQRGNSIAFSALAAELVRLKVDLICHGWCSGDAFAKEATCNDSHCHGGWITILWATALWPALHDPAAISLVCLASRPEISWKADWSCSKKSFLRLSRVAVLGSFERTRQCTIALKRRNSSQRR